MTQIYTTEDIVMLHKKEAKLVAITVFNGQTQIYKIVEPMNRREHQEFYETNPKHGHEAARSARDT